MIALLAFGLALATQVGSAVADDGKPLATIDLTTEAGARLVQATWRHADVALVPTEHRFPDANGDPTGPPSRTFTIEPRAGGVGFDDSGWKAIAPSALTERQGPGRVAFHWYRTKLTIPERIGDVDPTGSTALFEVVVDDYAEVWIDGELARALGQRGGSVVAGWNAPNRVVAKRGVRPGQQIEVAVFAGNGPISDPPANYVWIRAARLVFESTTSHDPVAIVPAEVNFELERLDPRLDAIFPANPKLWKLAEGFQFTEGPLWLADRHTLLFSDPNANRIYAFAPGASGQKGELRVFREKSGYDGADIGEYGQPGSNGLARDPRTGRIVVAEHGRRRIAELASDGGERALADRFGGKRLNSPNDLVFRSDGTLYFSDPPFGLPKFFDDPRKELPTSGVYALHRSGVLELVSDALKGPNGVAFSPDERFLYVTNWDEKRKVVLRIPIHREGRAGKSEVFFDMTDAPGAEALDGLEVDRLGNLYVSGPGGLWILAPDGTHLGTLRAPRLPANLAWGEDGRSLFLTARDGLYVTRLLVEGAGIAAER
ncbi:MAG: SMP-30/gluconolactonase/LRE family protein [Myxococcota bacterium]